MAWTVRLSTLVPPLTARPDPSCSWLRPSVGGAAGLLDALPNALTPTARCGWPPAACPWP